MTLCRLGVICSSEGIILIKIAISLIDVLLYHLVCVSSTYKRPNKLSNLLIGIVECLVICLMRICVHQLLCSSLLGFGFRRSTILSATLTIGSGQIISDVFGLLNLHPVFDLLLEITKFNR